MQGITIADSPNSLVIVLDKAVYSKERIEQALRLLRTSAPLDTSHLEPLGDEEQAELEHLLDSMTEEDRDIASIHYVRA